MLPKEAWKAYQQPILEKANELESLIDQSDHATISHLQILRKGLIQSRLFRTSSNSQ